VLPSSFPARGAADKMACKRAPIEFSSKNDFAAFDRTDADGKVGVVVVIVSSLISVIVTGSSA
jgi:hypothetical protein